MHVLQSPLLPLGAPSPTLTNPDMILPQSSPSTIRKPQRLPSPEPSDSGQNTFDSSNDDEHGIKGATYSPFRNGLPRRHDGPARIQSSFERGERIDQFQQSGSSREAGGEVPFASSPTIRDEYSLEEPKSYSEHASQDDGLADTSDSVYKTASVLDEDEDDPYSHAAMTRRAEEILANAKKRLTNMEGNLNRARSTLGNRPSPSVSSFSTHSPEPVSLYTLPAENGNLGGFSPSKHRQDHLSRVDENKQGHYRISSETSMPSTLHTNGQNGHSKASGENLDSKESHSEPGRSWFWNGLTRNTSINYASRRNNGLQPLNEDGPATESFEHPNAPRHEEIPDDETVDLSSPTVAAFKAQDPPATDLSRARSTRQMHELREQMQDLKGKISSLKRRAKEDNLRRRSLQSLRTPSPFTAAEQWYPGRQSQEHNQPNSRERSSDGDVSQNHCHTSPIAGRDGGIPDGEVNLDKALLDQPKLEEDAISGSPHVEEEKIDEDIIAMADRLILINEPSPVESEGKEDSLYGDQDYHDITTSPVVERHEDRPDAFDYEHFILHSVTGSYSGVGFRWSSSMRKRASSHSSTSSVETTKPRNSIVELMGEAVQETGSLSSGGHAKKTSVDSVSTNNTFATADEIRYSNDGQDWTPPRQTMAGSWQPEINKHNPNASPTSNKRRNKKHIYTALKSGAKIESNEKALPSPQSPDLLSYLTSFSSGEAVKEGERQAEPLQIGEGDRELVERLVESLAKLCAHLHNLGPDGTAHEARVCRHKLDTARRMLDGEVNGEAF